MLLVELVFTLVLAPVLPDIVAPAVHDAVLKLPLEVATVGPLENAETVVRRSAMVPPLDRTTAPCAKRRQGNEYSAGG